MITKDKVKKEIDQLTEVELEKVYLFLSGLNKLEKTRTKIRSLKLQGKLDDKDLRSVAYE